MAYVASRKGYLVACCLVLAVLAMQLKFPAAADASNKEQLAACINDGLQPQAMTFESMSKRVPPRFRAEQLLWSKKAAASQITVVTSLTPSRLGQLEAQCRSYRGPISAAAYVSLSVEGKVAQLTAQHKEQLQQTMQSMQKFHDRMESGDNCQLDLILLSEFVGDETTQVMFPVNTLRNYALLQARTALVAMVDVDLVISNMLMQWLKVPANQNKLVQQLTNSSTLVVLPAFETEQQDNLMAAYELATKAVHLTKEQLLQMVNEDEVYQFHVKQYPRGHAPTNYPKWFTAKDLYKVHYMEGFEPWFIIDRTQNPFYDEGFRGYGWNKVSHVLNVNHLGFTFLVHPTGFLVHRQHDRSRADTVYTEQRLKLEQFWKSKKQGAASKPSNNMATLTHQRRIEATRALKDGTYKPFVNPSIPKCVQQLPWWSAGAPAAA